jgi:hypothetical protein
MTGPAVPKAEALALVRKAITSQEVVVCPYDARTMAGIYPSIRLPEATLTFFLDCGELDYLDRVETTDGRRSEYEDWAGEVDGWLGHFPLDDLTDEEGDRLAQMLGAPGYLKQPAPLEAVTKDREG